MRVLFDTNFLMLPHTNKIDIFSGIQDIISDAEFITLSGIVDELKKLAAGRGGDAAAASVGIKLIEKENVKIIDSEGHVDDAIREYASKNEVVICTNDKVLRGRLRKEGTAVITLLGKDRLVSI
ncbi:MAG: nucleotide-binding protein [Candidatus Altiarchaeota archaeon]